MSSDHVRFREVQRFRQPWLMALLALGSGVSMSVFGCRIHRQLVMGDPWGQRPMSDSALLVVSIVTIGLTVGLLALFWRSALVVEMRGDG